jgi:hypothetical protein
VTQISRDAARRTQSAASQVAAGLKEDLVEVPLQELPARPVGLAFRQVEDLPGLGVELVAVAEIGPQPRADQQAVFGLPLPVVSESLHGGLGQRQRPPDLAVLVSPP